MGRGGNGEKRKKASTVLFWKVSLKRKFPFPGQKNENANTSVTVQPWHAITCAPELPLPFIENTTVKIWSLIKDNLKRKHGCSSGFCTAFSGHLSPNCPSSRSPHSGQWISHSPNSLGQKNLEVSRDSFLHLSLHIQLVTVFCEFHFIICNSFIQSMYNACLE